MSGAAFEGLPGLGEAGEEYEAGVVGFGRDLVEAVAESYLSGKLGRIYQSHSNGPASLYAGYYYCTKVIGSLLGEVNPGQFDHNLFIDDVLGAVASDTAWQKWEWQQPDWLLTSLVQSLYDLGFNDFHIAMPPGLSPHKPLCWLEGTEKNPLRVSYAAGKGEKDYISLGWKTRHCRITTTACADNIGTGAVSSVFVAGCEALYGSDARSCEFHIHSPSFRLPIRQDQCTYYAHAVSEKQNLRSLLDNSFFWRGNRMLYLDEKGRWREVRP